MMKKHLLQVLLCTGLLLCLLTVPALAADWTYDPDAKTLSGDIPYPIQNVTADENRRLTIGPYDYVNFWGPLDLTGTITGTDGKTYTLVAIADEAFDYCHDIRSLTLPASLESIGKSAFLVCYNLFTVDLSRCTKLTTIPERAFSGSTHITTVKLPTTLTSIGPYAFNACYALDTVNLSECTKLEAIEENAFCFAALPTLDLSQSVTKLGDGAFFDTHFTSVDLTEYPNLTDIGVGVFAQCRQLTSIKLPDNWSSIGAREFENCSALTSLDLSGYRNLTSIGNYAFKNCSSLTTLILPSSLTYIGEYAFSGCTALTTLDLSGCTGFTTIGEYAFAKSCLTSIHLPTTLTSLDKWAFSQCNSLTSLDLSACTQLTSLGDSVFWSCASLTSVKLPASLTFMKSTVFRDCPVLTELILLSPTPPTVSFTIQIPSDLRILVPSGSVEAYQTAEKWQPYADRIEPIDSDLSTLSVSGGTVSVNVLVEEPAWLLLTRYDGQRMTDSYLCQVSSSGTVTAILSGSGTTYKAFLLGGDTYAPLCRQATLI